MILKFDQKRIQCLSEDPNAYPELPDETFQPLGIWSKKVILQLHKQLPFLSDSVMGGIYVHQNAKLSSCATNGHILDYIKNLDPENECRLQRNFTGVIPGKSIQILSKFAYGEVKVAVGERYMLFVLPNKIELYIPLIQEKFVNFRKVLKKKLTHEIRIDRETLLKVVRFGKPLKTNTLKLTMQNGSLHADIDNRDEDINYEADVPVINRSGEAMKIGFNLKLFETTLKSIPEKEITWKYSFAT